MYILKPRSHCPGSPRCVPVKRAGKPDKPQNFPSPPPPPNDCFHNCRQSPCRFSGSTRVSLRACRPMYPGFTTVVYGGVPATAGHASVMSRCFPVLKIIGSGEKHQKHSNTGMYRVTTGSNWGSPWTFSVFGFRLESFD